MLDWRWFFPRIRFFFSTWEILSIYGVVPAQIPKSISKMLVRWCLPHKVCRFPTLRCWVTAGVNWVTAQWTPRLQCSDWGLLLFLSSQMTWKNMKKPMTIMEHPPFSDGFPIPKTSKINAHLPIRCQHPPGLSCRWVTGQVLREDMLVSLCARPYWGSLPILLWEENPSHLARWPSGPQTWFVGKCSFDNFPALDLRIYISLPCFFITGGYSQSINYPDLNITQKIMASSWDPHKLPRKIALNGWEKPSPNGTSNCLQPWV